MEQVPLPTVLALVAIGFIGGILFDRFILWPLAALLARRLDGDDPR